MHDNNWMFGFDYNSPTNNNGTLLHFEEGYPAFTIEDVKHDFGLYGIVCSDSSGNLLFHTNGRRIRNRLHNVMEGGDTINPGQVWADFPNDYPSKTGGIAIPAPGLPNHYYLIHTSASYNPFTPFPILYYTLIDMNQNGGLGKVVSKNNILAQGDLPSPVAIKHGNGRDWWLIAGDMLTQQYIIFLINPMGVQLAHIQSIAPASLTNYGYAQASPDGDIFISNDDSTGLWIFDFDRCQGRLSTPRVLPYEPPIFWTATNAFSPDGRFFYAGTHLVVYQVDMQTIDSSFLTMDTIARYDGTMAFSLPELAPDKKVYYTTFGRRKIFHTLHRPALPLLSSDLAHRGLDLPRQNDETRCYFPSYRLGTWSNSPCDTLGFVSPGNSQFRDVPWLENRIKPSTDTVRVLRRSPALQIPANTGQIIGEDYNPLNIRALLRKKIVAQQAQSNIPPQKAAKND